MTESNTSQRQSSNIQPGFMVLQSNRLEDLRKVTFDWLAANPLGPMEDELVLVQSEGVAQWLKMAMAASQDNGRAPGWGIAFGIKTLLPARFQWQAYRALLEQTAPSTVPEVTPFDRSHLRWMLYQQIPHLLAQPVYAPLQGYLHNDSQNRKLWQLVEKLADLFDQYQVYRADWLQAWSAGIDETMAPGGERIPLSSDQKWQAQLWRDLQASVDSQARLSHRAAVHGRFMAAAAKLSPASLPAALPQRLIVFGISSLPQQTLEALAVLARGMQIMLCMVNPCRHYWGDLIEDRQLLRQDYMRQQRKPGMPAVLNETTLLQHAHPLLAAWGKQGRDYLHLIDVHDQTNAYAQLFKDAGLQIDLFESPDTTTLLGQLQDDILELRTVEQARSHWKNPISPSSDHSFAMHITHSSHREMEVLHDQLLGALERDNTLLPSDIVVMMPDINMAAASIEAVFGQFQQSDPLYIPYQIADRLQRHQSPLLIALEMLLQLPSVRLTNSEVAQLLSVSAVQQRFGIDELDAQHLQKWINEANIRWGLSAQHREALGLPGFDGLNTWAFGLKRMMYGYAMGELTADEDAPDGILPYDEISGLSAAAIGPLARLIDSLDDFRVRLDAELNVTDWVTLLQELLATFFAAQNSSEERLIGQLAIGLDAWTEECGSVDFTTTLPLNVVAESWLQRIDESQAGQRYGGGAVTFATLMPMRAIPFRQVCLLGLTDEQFPRKGSRPDFDLMALRGQYRPGDRSRREDDRYLFLEALLAARDCLYLSWSGLSQKDNAEKPFSVLVGQLRDQIKQVWRLQGADDGPQGGEQLLAALTTQHPLQPFSRQYFTEQGTGASRTFTYAQDWAAALNKQHSAAKADAMAQLPAWQPDTSLTLKHLADMLVDPVKALFTYRFNVTLRTSTDSSADDEAFHPGNSLAVWHKQNQLQGPAGRRLTMNPEMDIEQALVQARQQQLLAGDYPSGTLGQIFSAEIAGPVRDALETMQHWVQRYPHRIDQPPLTDLAVIPCSDGPNAKQYLRLLDTVSHLFRDDAGQQARLVLETSKARDKGGSKPNMHTVAKHWPAHLALQCATDGAPTYIASPTGFVQLNPLCPDMARQYLLDLMIAWYDCVQRVTPVTANIAAAALAAVEGDIELMVTEKLLGNNKVIASINTELKKGDAFARQFASAQTVVEHEDFISTIKHIYLPLFSELNNDSGANL
jgi:exodeoxyribonuclease V gamma subunit